MTPQFPDTGYVFALESRSDQHHEAATRHWSDMASWPPASREDVTDLVR